MPRSCRCVPEVVDVQPELAQARLLDGLVPVPAVVRPEQPATTRADEHAALRPSLGPAPQMVTKVRHDRRGHSDLAHTGTGLRGPALDQHATYLAGGTGDSDEPVAQVKRRRQSRRQGCGRRPEGAVLGRVPDHPLKRSPSTSYFGWNNVAFVIPP